MGFFSKLFGGGGDSGLEKALKEGAVIIDVRTKQEYMDGHIRGSFNIPLARIPKEVKRLKAKKKPIVLCCRSGARAGSAQSVLKNAGIECYNGGGWVSLRKKVAAARK
ncbi:MAG TPA: rhodanese-like domain-containing protein [Saprospiraceae bacterium]|nr:rhodanese-like domain-containing protein [Saprospiraceae bacterium]